MNVAAWLLPGLIVIVFLSALRRGVNVLEAFVEGAQQGLVLVYNLVPYILAIYLALGLVQESGMLSWVTRLLDPLLSRTGIPAPLLPLLIVRPLSGSASLGVITQILQTYGPDSLVGRMASIMQGSSDTTFYVLTVYTGAAGVRETRRALPIALVGDLVGFAVAVYLAYHWPF
ncbi:MAG: spore maturation protein [Limnochordales bacterium]|nr:spore maturation protein [Limnochordales bacterium]